MPIDAEGVAVQECPSCNGPLEWRPPDGVYITDPLGGPICPGCGPVNAPRAADRPVAERFPQQVQTQPPINPGWASVDHHTAIPPAVPLYAKPTSEQPAAPVAASPAQESRPVPAPSTESRKSGKR